MRSHKPKKVKTETSKDETPKAQSSSESCRRVKRLIKGGWLLVGLAKELRKGSPRPQKKVENKEEPFLGDLRIPKRHKGKLRWKKLLRKGGWKGFEFKEVGLTWLGWARHWREGFHPKAPEKRVENRQDIP